MHFNLFKHTGNIAGLWPMNACADQYRYRFQNNKSNLLQNTHIYMIVQMTNTILTMNYFMPLVFVDVMQ